MAGAKNITVIPARKRVGNTVTADNKPISFAITSYSAFLFTHITSFF